jgi:hypothetical protein
MTGGGGLLQLVAQGKQDVFITGNPQITWFKMVYRRYTNFAVESQTMFFDGDPDFGKRLSCLVPRRGDLLGPMILELSLPQLYLTDGTAVSYCNSIGHAIIDEVSIEIGEQEIDKQTGEWMEIWSSLTTTADKRDGFYDMIGKVDAYTTPQLNGPLKLYVPLHFWFNRNPGLYLPLLALQYHPVRINIKLRPLQQLFHSSLLSDDCSPVQVKPAKITNMQIWGDYVFLDVEERRRFVSSTHEYLIEQIQYTPVVSIPSGNTVVNVPIEFNHPCKEFIWVIKRDIMAQYHEWFNFSSLSTHEMGSRIDLLSTAGLQLDGQDRFETRDAGYFRLVQPWQHHTVIPTDVFIYLYSFALRPEDQQPSGTMNASRIDTIVLNAGLTADSLLSPARGNASIVVYATNYNILRVVNGCGGVLFTI